MAEVRAHLRDSTAPGADSAVASLGATQHQLPVDSRQVVGYLTRPESDEYVAIMDVLEASVTDVTAANVTAALARAGLRLDPRVVEARLDALKDIGAVSARSDTSQARRFVELLARNWRYSASPVGRQVQRFFRTHLAGTAVAREIPIVSLSRVVTGLETLAAQLAAAAVVPRAAGSPVPVDAVAVETVNAVFTAHDDLDAALVGAEDTIVDLADRFDLDDTRTGELKGLLVDYATRVAAELDSGSARAAAALAVLEPYFDDLAGATVDASQARELIAAGAMLASRGGRVEDWAGLAAWFDGRAGRAARFSMRLVRTLPSMHANLRRLHSSTGTATNRARALALARAVLTPDVGVEIFQSALGDHSWRKLYGEADEDDAGWNPSWRSGPQVPVPALLRSAGRSGPRGKGTTPRDDSLAREQVARDRARRAAAHSAAVAEVLAAGPNAALSEPAARAALASLMASARTSPRGARRTGTSGGLACTLVRVVTGVGVLAGPTWHVLLLGRAVLFHLPGQAPSPAVLASVTAAVIDDEARVPLEVTTDATHPADGQQRRSDREEGVA